MGNTHSASNRAGRPASPPPAPHSHPPPPQPYPPGDAAADPTSTAPASATGHHHPESTTSTSTTTGSASASASPPPPSSSSPSAARQHRRDTAARHPSSIIPIHTAHRAAAPPEPSLAQAQGSTAAAAAAAAATLPSTAVSSLSGSPHSSSAGNDFDNSSISNRSYNYHHGTNPSNSIDNSVHSTAATTPARRFSESRPPTSTSASRDTPSKPVDVPSEAAPLRPFLDLSAHPHLAHGLAHHQPALMATNSYSDMYIGRPPRLPLPIEEEVHTPGSPIIGPDETFDLGEAAEGLTRKSSTLSSCTVDDDEGEELRVDKTRPVVPTRLEWRGGGDKVYVTGTIFQWNRKHRLHPVEGQPGVFSATIYILPGTHHVRFLVDGIMQTSPHLPTTVDFGNNLVNYIEVNPDDARREKSPVLGLPKSSAAAAAADYDDDGIPASSSSSSPPSSSSRAQAHHAHPREQQHHHHQHQHAHYREEQHQHQNQQHQHQHQQQLQQLQHQQAQQRSLLRGKPCPPVDSFRREIPQYLLDFDQPEESPAYRHAVAAIEKLPTPPSLPGFLGKPILNAATLMKDDNSVLNMPNHTILNHLATSSIKNNVLAVSATTRYHNKYVTTIIYKPTSSDEG